MKIFATISPYCHVKILDCYLSKVYPGVDGEHKFYLYPLPYTPTGSMPWYFNEPLPTKKLQTLLKTLCKSANIKSNWNNTLV